MNIRRLRSFFAKYSYDSEFQKTLFKVFTPIAYVFLLTYTVVQFYQGQHVLASIYAAASVLLLFNLLWLREHGNFGLATNFFAALGPLVLLPWQVTGVFGHAAFLWFFAYIWFVLTFTGRYFGSFWFTIMYGLSIAISLRQLSSPEPLFENMFLLQFYFCSAIVYLLIVLFLKAQEEVNDALIRQSELLEQSQKVARLGNWEWDIVNDKVAWSKELFKIVGRKPTNAKISYDTYLSKTYEPDREMLDSVIKTALQNQQSFSVEHRAETRDGQIVWIHGEGRTVLDENGNPIKMIGIAQDITERKNAEKKLQVQNEELQKLNNLMVGRELKMIELKKRLQQSSAGEEKI